MAAGKKAAVKRAARPALKKRPSAKSSAKSASKKKKGVSFKVPSSSKKSSKPSCSQKSSSSKTPLKKCSGKKPIQLDEKTARAILEKATKKKRCGYGGFANVFRTTFKGETCALKVGKKKRDEESEDTGEDVLNHEIERLLEAQGIPHVIRILAYYKRPANLKHDKKALPPMVLLQWAPKDLCDNAGDFSRKQYMEIWSKVLLALSEIHKKQVHYDVKPENIFLDAKKNVFLGDFGLAETNYVSRMQGGHEASGSHGYEAPEVRKCVKQNLGFQAHKCDVYSAGVSVAHGMMFADDKFAKKHKKALDLLDDGKDVNLDKHFLCEDPLVRYFFIKTLSKNPKQRCTALQASKMLQKLIEKNAYWS